LQTSHPLETGKEKTSEYPRRTWLESIPKIPLDPEAWFVTGEFFHPTNNFVSPDKPGFSMRSTKAHIEHKQLFKPRVC
jgi:hypothetical protein